MNNKNCNLPNENNKNAVLLGEKLIHAVVAGDFELVKELIQASADVNVKCDYYGKTALIYAIEGEKNIDWVKLLLESGADINAQDNYGISAFTYAVLSDNLDAAKILMKAGADAEPKDIQRAFEKAALKGDQDLVQLFVNKGADVNSKDFLGHPILIEVVLRCRKAQEMVSFLIDLGADVNTKESLYGETALIKVVIKTRYTFDTEDADMMKLLIEKGADVNIKSKYDAKFENELSNDEAISIVLNLQKKLNFMRPEKPEINLADELTPLMIACQKDEREIVRILIRASADLNIQNKYGDTALHLALKLGNCFIAKLLIASGADFDLQNNLGQTPLILAAAQGNDCIVRDLIDAKAKIGIIDQEEKGAIS